MPKWVRKAASLGNTGHRVRDQPDTAMLNDIIVESHRALDDLQFIIDHTSFGTKLTADAAGLTAAEAFYRDAQASKERAESFPDEQVERLIALFFGYVFTQNQRGKWVVYPGTYHVYHPVVIELVDHPKRYIQPFLYCTGMRTKQLQGMRDNKSLTMLYEEPQKSCTP